MIDAVIATRSADFHTTRPVIAEFAGFKSGTLLCAILMLQDCVYRTRVTGIAKL